MFIAVQVALAVIGLFIMTRGRFEVGDRAVTNPVASLVGIVLIAQLPVALLIGILLALNDGPALIPVPGDTPVRPEDAYWWIDPLVTCGAVVMAATVTAIALRAENEAEDVYASLHPVTDEPAADPRQA